MLSCLPISVGDKPWPARSMICSRCSCVSLFFVANSTSRIELEVDPRVLPLLRLQGQASLHPLVDQVDKEERQSDPDDARRGTEGQSAERLRSARIGGESQSRAGADHRQIDPARPPGGGLLSDDTLPERRPKLVDYMNGSKRRDVRPRREDRNGDHGWILAQEVVTSKKVEAKGSSLCLKEPSRVRFEPLSKESQKRFEPRESQALRPRLAPSGSRGALSTSSTS